MTELWNIFAKRMMLFNGTPLAGNGFKQGTDNVIGLLPLFQIYANNNDIHETKGHQPEFQEYLGSEYKLLMELFWMHAG